MSQFQAKNSNKLGIKNIIQAINGELDPDDKLEAPILDSVFEKWWSELNEKLEKILAGTDTEEITPTRNSREILDELLAIARKQNFQQTNDNLFGISAGSRLEFIHRLPVKTLCMALSTNEILDEAGIACLGDFTLKTEEDLLQIPKLGRSALNEIRKHLAIFGIKLKSISLY